MSRRSCEESSCRGVVEICRGRGGNKLRGCFVEEGIVVNIEGRETELSRVSVKKVSEGGMSEEPSGRAVERCGGRLGDSEPRESSRTRGSRPSKVSRAARRHRTCRDYSRPSGQRKNEGERMEAVLKIDLIVQELEEMGGGYENLYSSDGHQHTGGAAPPWLMNEGELFWVTSGWAWRGASDVRRSSFSGGCVRRGSVKRTRAREPWEG
jgi:hypothetical protein